MVWKASAAGGGFCRCAWEPAAWWNVAADAAAFSGGLQPALAGLAVDEQAFPLEDVLLLGGHDLALEQGGVGRDIEVGLLAGDAPVVAGRDLDAVARRTGT